MMLGIVHTLYRVRDMALSWIDTTLARIETALESWVEANREAYAKALRDRDDVPPLKTRLAKAYRPDCDNADEAWALAEDTILMLGMVDARSVPADVAMHVDFPDHTGTTWPTIDHAIGRDHGEPA